MNDEYIPKPSRSATALVVQTPRIRIMRMSTSGWSERDSLRTQNEEQHDPDRDQADRLRREPVPGRRLADGDQHGGEPGRHQRRPAQLTRPGTRIGDSGTKTWINTVAITIGISGSQKR